ncbi:MAG: group 1 glycosyl transferase [Parcubacteria group bacterium Gr01-1014_38]|nr:MAG: group 1 glycosyl transferase [Parcubacteria group bacterium Gr01-1014_38]
MRVLFLSARYPPDVLGGGEISTQLIAEALAATGASVTVVCGAAGEGDDVLHGVRVIRTRPLLSWWSKPLREVLVSRAAAQTVAALLPRHALQPDVIHAQEFRSALSLSFLPHPHRIVTIRDYAPICGTTNNMWWDGSSCDGCFWTNVLFRCHRVVEASLPRKPFRVAQYKGNLGFRTRAFRRIPHHLYTSQCLRRRVEARLRPPPTVQTMILQNPVDPRWLTTPLVPRPEENVLCAAGRLETTKGTDILLQAVAEAQKTFPDLRLHLAGSGELPRYRALADRLGLRDAVTFHGAVPPAEVSDLMDRSAIVVSAHLWEEPFGRAALEAGARARPLVASDLGGVLETTTSQTAALVPPNDPSALAGALIRLLRNRDDATAMGDAARAYVKERFAPQSIANQLLQYYDRCARDGVRERGEP